MASVVRFKDPHGQICAVSVKDYGCPKDVAKRLATFLRSRELTNGIPSWRGPSAPARQWANGMGCLAAQFVADNKTEPGDLYMVHPGAKDYHIYEVAETEESVPTSDPVFRAFGVGLIQVTALSQKTEEQYDTVFTGTVEEFNAWTRRSKNRKHGIDKENS